MIISHAPRFIHLGTPAILLLLVAACGSSDGGASSSPEQGEGGSGTAAEGDGGAGRANSGSNDGDAGSTVGSAGGSGNAAGAGNARNGSAGAADDDASGGSSASENSNGGTSSAGRSSGNTSGGTSNSDTTTGPRFDGSGESFRPLTVGCGPETADLCTGECEGSEREPDTVVVRAPATLCFAGEGDLAPEDPSVVIEQVIEEQDGVEYVHLRVTFDPAFTDNTYGEGSCCGWPNQRGHTFEDLVKSDHTELLLTDANGSTIMNFKIDLVSQDPTSSCGYGSLGVTGGDGAMIEGDPSHVLAVATSLDRNLNGCGYCEEAACAGDCTLNSPSTNEGYAPNAATPDWDFRQVYEAWVSTEAFGASGFGQAYITYTHSSPAKGQDTIQVEPSPCPPEWDSPYCEPGDPSCDGGTGGAGGASGAGGSGQGGAGDAGSGGAGGDGSTGSGGSGAGCPPNQQIYMTSEGPVCTPIPFANYPGMAACPEGYELDVASEGRYCLPETM